MNYSKNNSQKDKLSCVLLFPKELIMSCRKRGGGGGIEYNSKFFNQIINYQISKLIQPEIKEIKTQ